MSPQIKFTLSPLLAGVLASVAGGVHAVTFETENVSGSFDSTITTGFGVRAKSSNCSLVITGATGPGAPTGCLAPTSGMGDQGNLNYGRGDIFTAYLKGSHELLLKLPHDIRFMARANWVRDFKATDTTGVLSATTPPTLSDGLADDARDDLRFKARLLDLWVSKTFAVGEQQVRVRAGNQVISWGESIFLPGGVNTTNAMDFMRLSQPGTQLKEVFLPAPMVSVASGLGNGLNVEGYVQARWNASYFPPTGSYWSAANGLGKGHDAYGLSDVHPKDSGQWGLALRYQPKETPLQLGLYAVNYHDKTPQLSFNIKDQGTVGWTYLENRRMYGVSANFPIGDWAIGTELSYRPRDGVSLNANASGCSSQGGNCWVDSARYQWHLTGLLSLTPSGTGQSVLSILGADTATLLAEAVVVRYPKLKQSYGGDPISAGLWGWGQEFDAAGAPTAVGTKTSAGFNFDFSWVYDGTLLPGWQVIPGVYYYQALSGRTPNISAMFMKGAKSANVYVNFVQNPANWQFGVNYAKFWGGSEVFDQPLRDRDYFGAYLSRNF